MSFTLVDHQLVPEHRFRNVKYELVPARTPAGAPAEGLFAAWITLDNEAQYNSYTTEMVKDVILAFRKASVARDVVAIVFTGAGSKAFCTGGNTKEYAEYYAGRPDEYAQYMRLFNDMVSAILEADKPVICRVNGMRVGGGQEIGMACDYSVASDLAVFGQAGPKHGSAPDGGATDFLPLFVGIEAAIASCTLCEPWTAYQAHQRGLIGQLVPVLRVDGSIVRNPTVITDRWIEDGALVYGASKRGDALAAGKALLARGQVDLAPLDEAVGALVTKLMMTMPGCLTKTLGTLRKHKLEHWDQNKETSRAWLSLNMMTEARAGFRAFNEGTPKDREIDFVKLRRELARGAAWGPELIESVLPRSRR
jgi:6-oxo-cyclohex-1-ene-carbonyl-CoA hydrolase